MKKIILGQYELGGGMGSWAKSFEKNARVGDVRMIGGVLMYAYIIYKRTFRKTEVNWCPVNSEKNNMDSLRQWLSSSM